MFRKMRRPKQALTNEECIEILKRTKRGVISVIGDDGYPYGTPMNHYYDETDGKLYFHSALIGHRVDALKACNKVSFCVYEEEGRSADSWALNFKCVHVFGRAEMITDADRVSAITRRLSYKFTDDDEYIENEISRLVSATLCFAITPEQITGKRVNES